MYTNSVSRTQVVRRARELTRHYTIWVLASEISKLYIPQA